MKVLANKTDDINPMFVSHMEYKKNQLLLTIPKVHRYTCVCMNTHEHTHTNKCNFQMFKVH